MASYTGLIKTNHAVNRAQQRADWVLICQTVGKELPAPDWSASVKKVDAYMAQVCRDHNLDPMKYFGRG